MHDRVHGPQGNKPDGQVQKQVEGTVSDIQWHCVLPSLKTQGQDEDIECHVENSPTNAVYNACGHKGINNPLHLAPTMLRKSESEVKGQYRTLDATLTQVEAY